jgi:PAS domain S-box-containing protein
MPALSLKTKMSLVVSLFVTVVITLLAVSALWYFEGELKNTISRHQFAMISAMAEEIDSKMKSAQLQLISVSGTAASNLAGNPHEAQKFLDTHVGIRSVFDSGIFIFSPTGTLIAASPAEPSLQGRDYSFREYIKKTAATGRPYISMPFFSTQMHHHPIIMFTAPIFDANGKMTGILTGALDLIRDNFLGKLATVRLGDRGYLYLYSTDRTMIVHPDRTRILKKDVPLGVNKLFDRAIEGFEGTDETVNSRGLHALSSFKRLKSTNWILAANFPQSEAYAPIYRAKGYLLASAIMALILSNIIVWWFMRHLTAPLLLFTRHVKGITGKEYEPMPLRIAQGDEIGTLAQAFNDMLAELDGQKRANREQKEFSENLLLDSAVPTFVLDNRHRVIIWNKACEKLTGIKASEILGKEDAWRAFYRNKQPVLADFVIDGDIGEIHQYYSTFNNSPFTPDGLQAEGWCLTLNDLERYVFFDAAPVRNTDGEVVAVVETILDITERKRMEEAIRESEERYRALVELSPDAIYVHTGGRMIFANSEGAKLLGVNNPEDIYGREARDFVHPDSWEFVSKRIAMAFQSGEPNPPAEEIFVGVDGSHVPVEVASVPYKYQGENALLIIARDITDRRKMQEELLKAQKLESLGVLAGGIAHDFNNILTGILGNLSIAKLQTDPSDKIIKRLELCEKAANMASELTRQLLTFSRGGAPVKKLINPTSLIRETVSFVLRGSNTRSIIDIQDNIWCLEADESQLSQVLNNLLLNAIQAMPSGGEIKVRAANETLLRDDPHRLQPGYYIMIAVEDSGCGIQEENLVKIFDPYFTSKPTGSGLGLASVYSIVKRHGGEVDVSSTLGAGTIFTIHLPALPGRKPEDAEAKAPDELKGSGRVLIMDDEDFIRDIATYTLDYLGYEVESCMEGSEALDLFLEAWNSNSPFSAVILDLTIPGGMGGKEAAALMLDIDPDAVLIVSSGYSDDPVIASFRQYGFSGVLTKPFDAEGLARELKRLIPVKS